MTLEELTKTYAAMTPAFITGSLCLGEEFKRLEGLEYDIQELTGYSMSELRDRFAAGWTLKAPYPAPTMSQLVMELEEV